MSSQLPGRCTLVADTLDDSVDGAVSAQAVRSAYRGVVCWLAKGIGDGLPEVTGRVVRRDIPVRSWEIVDEIYVLRVASS